MLKAVVNSPVRSGDQTINNGNLVIGTAGKGIDFSADSHAAGMTSELLSDYEEGAFTPTVTFSGGNGTLAYVTQVGRYTKIGRLVHVQAYVEFTKGTASGNLDLSGLPFASVASSPGFSAISITLNGFSGLSGGVQGLVNPNATIANLGYTGTGAATAIADTNVGASPWISYSFSYITP